MPEMKPILFNTDMVRAILDGRKTVTRRVVKNAPKRNDLKPYDTLAGYGLIAPNSRVYHIKPPYRPNDIIYVRETWHQTPNGKYWYKADSLCTGCTEDGRCLPKGVPQHEICKLCDYVGGYDLIKWRPSIHMPREAARIFLRVTDVQVEMLQDITEEGSIKEGFEPVLCNHPGGYPCTDCMNTGYLEPAMLGFVETWNSTIKKADRARYGWDANPWCWVIEFERISREEAMKCG